MKATIKSDQVASFGVVLGLLIVFASNGFAGSATWKSSPATGDWNTATNWTPQTVPNGPSDVATFGTSNQTAVSVSAQTEVNGITFNSGAGAFTITVLPNNSGFSLNISGVGVTNNSGTTQNIVATRDPADSFPGSIHFFNSAAAGSSTSYSLNGGYMFFHNSSTAGTGAFSLSDLGNIFFEDSATAQNANFTLNTATIHFDNTSTAGSGTFTLNAPNVQGEHTIVIFDGGTAGNATFTVNGGTTLASSVGSQIQISSSASFPASAGAATFIANAGSNGGDGGGVYFSGLSNGGTSRIELFGNGTGDFTDGYLAIYGHRKGNVTIGSVEGTGSVFLGSNRLSVGSNDLSTTLSGVIVDCPASDPSCGSSGPFGSLSKIGRGKLALSHSSGNTYTGGTTINKGTLIASNSTGSATGSGPVQVNSGTLSGTGVINGAVTVGNGTRTGAILQPGVGMTPGTLTINNSVTFNAPSAFKCTINRSSTPVAGKLKALGVTIGTNVSFTLVETGTTTLTPGTVFIVINNTSANPIFGTFSNLPDGGTITSANGTVYKANYSGETGNDLTLTVQ